VRPRTGEETTEFTYHFSSQGFRKYLTQAKDHEELLAFLLGQIVKEKARLYQLQRYEQPELVAIKVAELDERVSNCETYPVRVSVTDFPLGEGTRYL
jgi:hypothetical protein